MGWLSNFYNPEFFPDPYTFNPDRWNEPLESPYYFTPFSAGNSELTEEKEHVLEKT